jgi:hypothetical protein
VLIVQRRADKKKNVSDLSSAAATVCRTKKRMLNNGTAGNRDGEISERCCSEAAAALSVNKRRKVRAKKTGREEES